MDTRAKIRSRAGIGELAAGKQVRWVSGHFDPLLAQHARHLRQFSSPDRLLVVEVTNPAQPLLSQRARAELVAALGMVDYVVLSEGNSQAADDAPITEQFIERVRSRHRGEGTG